MLSDAKKQKRVAINTHMYNKVGDFYKSGHTLQESCSLMNITRERYYYICKTINKKSCASKYGGSRNIIGGGQNINHTKDQTKTSIDNMNTRMICDFIDELYNEKILLNKIDETN